MKRTVSSISGIGKTAQLHTKKKKKDYFLSFFSDYFLIEHTEIKSKWIKDLNI